MVIHLKIYGNVPFCLVNFHVSSINCRIFDLLAVSYHLFAASWLHSIMSLRRSSTAAIHLWWRCAPRVCLGGWCCAFGRAKGFSRRRAPLTGFGLRKDASDTIDKPCIHPKHFSHLSPSFSFPLSSSPRPVLTPWYSLEDLQWRAVQYTEVLPSRCFFAEKSIKF